MDMSDEHIGSTCRVGMSGSEVGRAFGRVVARGKFQFQHSTQLIARGQ